MFNTNQFPGASDEGNGRTFVTPHRITSRSQSPRTFYAERGEMFRAQRYQGDSSLVPGIGQEELPFATHRTARKTDGSLFGDAF